MREPVVIRPTELCRAKHPERRMLCDLVGPHEKHVVTFDAVIEGDVREMRSEWSTCNALVGPYARPCLRVLRHDGDHQP